MRKYGYTRKYTAVEKSNREHIYSRSAVNNYNCIFVDQPNTVTPTGGGLGHWPFAKVSPASARLRRGRSQDSARTSRTLGKVCGLLVLFACVHVDAAVWSHVAML